MINGAHSIIYSTNPDADRAFLRDVLELTHVDVGGGWLIITLDSTAGAQPLRIVGRGTARIADGRHASRLAEP